MNPVAQATVHESWRILPFVTLLYFVSFLDRVNVEFAAFSMNQAIGLTPAMFGFGSGLFFLGYLWFEVPSNLILRRVGVQLWTWSACRNFEWTEDHCDRALLGQKSGRSRVED